MTVNRVTQPAQPTQPTQPARRPPELLAPAGSMAMLETALAFGATAIYAGQPRYSLRVRNNSFARLPALAEGVARTHAAGAKCYIVSNIYPHNAKVRTYLADMAEVVALKPDALIMADPGLIDLVRETWPQMPIHLSVQANTVNWAAVRFWRKLGIERVILSRELSLDEIAEIRQQCPDTELEVFVHGALCIAYSGRCLLSGYFNHRDPNQGTCTNSCRWDYRLKPASEEASGDLRLAGAGGGARRDDPEAGGGACQTSPAQGLYFIEEAQRPGQLMPIEEDEHGSYIMNSRDLRAIEHVQRLIDIGVDSLKIEGRTKSPYYVARACQAYRQAIDDALAGRPLDVRLLGGLEGLANRGYTDGFYQRHQPAEYQNYLQGSSQSTRSLYVGNVLDYGPTGLAQIEVMNRFAVGDRLEIIHPRGNFDVQLDAMQTAAGAPTTVAPGNGHRVYIALPPGYERAFVARYA